MMKEKTEVIAKGIKRHRELELAINATNKAVARSKVSYNGKDSQFWIINKENKGGVQFIEDITGSLTGTQVGNRTTITEDGMPIYKNTKLAEILIKHHEGNHINLTPTGKIPFEIFNRTIYKPSDNDEEYATELSIQLAGETKILSFRTLIDILKESDKFKKDIEELERLKETASEQEAIKLVDRIAKKELAKKAYLEKAQSFIRKYAELRYQPILDPQQEEIKRSNIFDGTLIINGGPGTGKTTSLIQRIKFLIDIAINDVGKDYLPNINSSQKAKFSDKKNSWIFFSPNELLALFLRNSMNSEGLAADNDKVKVWSEHKRELIKAYRLVNTETKRPFLFYNKKQEIPLLGTTLKKLKPILSGLDKYYLNFQNEKLDRIKEINTSSFKWKSIGNSIQNYINRQSGIYGLENLIKLYNNLNETFDKDVKKISEEYLQLVNRLSSRIQVKILENKQRNDNLKKLLKAWKIESQLIEVDEDEIDKEDFGETEDTSTFDFERALFIKIKSLARKQALKKYDKNTKLTKRDKKLLEIIPELEEQEDYDDLGQLAFFKKYFERISKGIISNIFREIPMIYKRFRREQFSSNKSKGWNRLILAELVKKDENKRIHLDEQALLLNFINGLVSRVAKSFKRKYNEMNNPFINGYKNYNKPVIGVDEATDFHLIDLLAIHSLGDSEISSVTYSGDLMQRMTKMGLCSWDDLRKVIPKTEISNLKTSYRQSSTLLGLAKEIYKKSTNLNAEYTSYIEETDSEPKPLMFISENDESKIEWIAERIHEIYKAYGESIPSIAIFLPKENQLEGFAFKLGSMDTLADVGIQVKASRNGEVLGDKNTVRVFSIEVIKGLEFEAVFFHNMDELSEQNLENELLLKHLYVGLSRATFYLGLTLKYNLDENLSFLNGLFENNGNWEIV